MEYKLILKYFNDQAKLDKWDQLYNSSNPLSHSFIHRLRKSIGLIKPYKNPSLLDLGCGTGILIPYALKNKYKYHGLDNSLFMLNFIKTKYKHEFDEKKITLINSDFSAFNFKKKFDIIFGIGFIEYFDNPYKNIKILLNNLEDNGQLILSFPNKYSLENLILKILYLPKKLLSIILNKSTIQPPRTNFSLRKTLNFIKSNYNYKIEYKNKNINLFVYPFSKILPKFSNYFGNIFEDSIISKFSFFSTGFIISVQKISRN